MQKAYAFKSSRSDQTPRSVNPSVKHLAISARRKSSFSPIMLSTAHSNLHERHRQHRRQISTPSALDAVKAPSLPAQAMHRYHAHRRGQSFDNRALRVQRSQSMQDGTTHTTNTTVPQPHHPNMLGDSQHQRYLCVAQPSFPQQSAPMPMIPDCFTPEEVQNLQSHNGQDSQPSMAYLNAPFGKDVPHMNMHFDLMQQQQMHSAKVPCGSGTEGQFFETGFWDFYQPTFSGQADVRKLSVQSEATPSQHPHTPKPGNTRTFMALSALFYAQLANLLCRVCPDYTSNNTIQANRGPSSVRWGHPVRIHQRPG